MSLTIRMRRAIAAFRAPPHQPFLSVGSEKSAMIVAYGGGGSGGRKLSTEYQPSPKQHPGDSQLWTRHTRYHTSRVYQGMRLNYFINERGVEKLQHGTIMYRGKEVKSFLANAGLPRP